MKKELRFRGSDTLCEVIHTQNRASAQVFCLLTTR